MNDNRNDPGCDIDCQACRRKLCTGAWATLTKPRPAKPRPAKRQFHAFREYLKTIAR